MEANSGNLEGCTNSNYNLVVAIISESTLIKEFKSTIRLTKGGAIHFTS